MLESREQPRPDFFGRLFRWFDGVHLTMSPFDVDICTPRAELVARLSRGVAVTNSQVTVFNEHNVAIGSVLKPGVSVGGSFEVLGADGGVLYAVKGQNRVLREYHFLVDSHPN